MRFTEGFRGGVAWGLMSWGCHERLEPDYDGGYCSGDVGFSRRPEGHRPQLHKFPHGVIVRAVWMHLEEKQNDEIHGRLAWTCWCRFAGFTTPATHGVGEAT